MKQLTDQQNIIDDNNLTDVELSTRDKSPDSSPARYEIKQNFIAFLNMHLRHWLKCNLTPLYSLPNNVNRWTVFDVHTFVSILGYASTADLLVRNNVDGIALLLMRREDFVTRLELTLGPAVKLYEHIKPLHGYLEE